MNLIRIVIAAVFASGLTLSGCGGGGGGIGGVASIGKGGGIGGTGVTSSGTIDGFGSIFVNGVEFETDDSIILLDGMTTTADMLRLGMVVTVRGTLNEDGRTGTATEVVYDDEVRGPVSSIVAGPDGDTLLIKVLGVSIIAERTGTVFDGVSFGTLAVNDLVEVSGFVESGLKLRATRIEKVSTFQSGASAVKLKGTVSNLTPSSFELGEFTVDYSSAELSGFPEGVLVEGIQVEVYGTLENNTVQATRVELEGDLASSFADQEDISVQGAITDFVNQAHFVVNGIAVDASNAAVEPSGLVLANGLIAEVAGVWNGTTLVAETVTSRRGRVELAAQVSAVDVTGKTVTLQFFSGSVTVTVDNKTQLKDETGRVNPFSLGAINSGDFLQVEGINVGGSLVASRISRDDASDSVLQAPVDSFNAGIDITLLGVRFSTAGAKFEDQSDTGIDTGAFFAQLHVGDLVRVKDDDPQDGIANEVELEREDVLDGHEFDDESTEVCDSHETGDACPPDDNEDTEPVEVPEVEPVEPPEVEPVEPPEVEPVEPPEVEPVEPPEVEPVEPPEVEPVETP
ncbi:MAG: DUF5666 domain-containing protein [Halioglobus sp.]